MNEKYNVSIFDIEDDEYVYENVEINLNDDHLLKLTHSDSSFVIWTWANIKVANFDLIKE